MKLPIFEATPEEKEEAIVVCNKMIKILTGATDEISFRAYIIQTLLESFEETHDIDISHSVPFSSGEEDEIGEERG